MKKVILKDEARKGLYKGVQLLTDVVQTTLGPRGSNVIFDATYGLAYPIVTKDGVTVAKNVDSDDPLESMGIRLVRHASQLTNQEVGDGTTTSTVITNEIVQQYTSSKKINNVRFINGMKRAQELIENFIDKHTVAIHKDVEKIRQIAHISANNDKVLGDLVADAYNKVGQYGSISVQPSKTGKNYIEFKEGLEFNAGVPAVQFLEIDKPITVVENAEILVTNFEIKSMSELAVDNALSKTLFVDRKPVVLICSDIAVEVLGQLLYQIAEQGVKLYVVKAPHFGASRDAFLMDIAILTGGNYLDASLGDKLADIKEADFGKASSVHLTMDKTVILGGKGKKKAIADRIKYMSELLDEKDLSDEMRDAVQERLHKLSGGVAEIFIDAISDVQYEETSFRVKDAISATGASYKGGAVAGGGSTLFKASIEVQKQIDIIFQEGTDEHLGASVLLKAIMKPFAVILENAGLDVQEYKDKVLKEYSEDFMHVGVDVMDGTVCDMYEKGVIDPALVTKSALRNAVRMGGTLLTTSSAIVTYGDN